MAPEPLSRQEIQTALKDLRGWSFDDNKLTRTFTFEGHLAAAAIVGQIARVQDHRDHHADLTLSYDKVTVAVNTHSVGGRVTELDVDLARRIEELVEEHGVGRES
ncbi:4a-hydroxytetrahydrobiopterin dehydratase [Streptomyces sp. URMC 123]|uniref:4a-hydroxytetrahydrobiopterin dehydratase n=1 Tax=Streptomyces sp. URMC 123 TaxID=3423403 RepID=UPI003F1E42F8